MQNLSEWVGRGAWGGFLGGLALAVWAMLYSALQGGSIWAPVALIAAFLLGAGALSNVTLTVLVVGLVTHVVTSLVLGAIFGYLASQWLRLTSPAALTAAGTAYGLIIWLAVQYVVGPQFNRAVAARMDPFAFAIGHLIFGLVLGLVTAPLARRAPAASGE